MRNLIFIALCSSLFLSCTKRVGHQISPESTYKTDEFIFIGDTKVVEEYLKEKTLSYEITSLDKQSEVRLVAFKGNTIVEKVVEELSEKVELIQPNYRHTVASSQSAREDTYSWPNDKYFFRQWGSNNVGQSPFGGISGKRGADLNLLKAWKEYGDKVNPNNPVIVAVIDTGVNYNHPDFKKDGEETNIWINKAEFNGKPGIDDDNNGYTDDIYGYDFTQGEREGLHYGQLGDPDPKDENGHGTHCAGVIGAKSGNGIGIAGVMQNVKIMSLRALGKGGGYSADLYRAIKYAAENNADIISASWGSNQQDDLIKRIIKKVGEENNLLFITSAGNSGSNTDATPAYPSSYIDKEGDVFGNILTVGASDNQDNPANFSNYGNKGVHVFAPGVSIVSTWLGKGYAVLSGTSMATPYVAGVAAFMMSVNPKFRKNPKLVINTLIATSDKKLSLTGKSISNGRVNAYRAISETQVRRELPIVEWNEEDHKYSEMGFNKELFDLRYKIEKPGSRGLKIHFNFIQINEPYTSIYIYDKNFNLIDHVPFNTSLDYWSAVIPGDTAYVRYVNSKVRLFVSKTVLTNDINNSPLTKSTCEAYGAEDIKFGTNNYGNEFVKSCTVDNPVYDPKGTSRSEEIMYFQKSMGFEIDKIKFTNNYEEILGASYENK